MKEIDCIQKLKETAMKLLENTNMFSSINVLKPEENQLSRFEIRRPDIVLNVRTKDKKNYSLVFEIKSIGQPRYARMAMNQLQAMTSSQKNTYAVFGASYLSEESIKICRENNIGFIDIAGNCFIEFDNVYIDIQGKPNPYPTTRPLKSLYAQKSTRALRVLLLNPRKIWTVKELVKESNLSLGQASNIKKKLLDYEFILERNKKFSISNPEELINKWADNYTFRKNRMKNYYSFDEIKEIEINLSTYCESNKIRYAFTLTSGASLVAPFLRYNRVFAYISGSMKNLAEALGWKEVSSGPNISLLEPYDEGVFYGLQDINKMKVVSDVQLYLDLLSYRERGEEAAKFLYEKRLKEQW